MIRYLWSCIVRFKAWLVARKPKPQRWRFEPSDGENGGCWQECGPEHKGHYPPRPLPAPAPPRKTRTDWYDGSQCPAVPGFYERNHWPSHYDTKTNDFENPDWAPRDLWTGAMWVFPSGHKYDDQQLPWRGLAADPRARGEPK